MREVDWDLLRPRSDFSRLELRQLETRLHLKTYRKPFWVRFVIRECPICGSHNEYRERVYDKPKPQDPAKRYDFNPMAFDWCC